jgi:hypothetical protein
MSTKRRRVRPPRFGHDFQLPPCVSDEVIEALCEVLRFDTFKRHGRIFRREKRDGRLPAEPTTTLPLSPEREAVYQTRALLHEALHHPLDARYAAHQGWRGRKWGDSVLYRGAVDPRASTLACARRNGTT